MIEYSLKQALLWETKKMSQNLFEYELEELVDVGKSSLKKDNNDYVLFLTERDGEIAMFLILKDEKVLVNEEAKAELKKLSQKGYKHNLKFIIPMSAKELAKGIIPNYGFTIE